MLFHPSASTVWILLSAMAISGVLAQCPAARNRKFGFVKYYFGGVFDRNQEVCDWKFDTSRSDVVFAMQLSNYYGDAVVNSFTAPDGKEIFSKDYTGWSEGWCGSYVKQNAGNETTCRPTWYPEMCKNKSTVSLTWPPQLTTSVTLNATSESKIIEIVYAFLECPPKNKITPRQQQPGPQQMFYAKEKDAPVRLN